METLEYSIEEKFERENYRDTYKMFNEVDKVLDYIENYKNNNIWSI